MSSLVNLRLKLPTVYFQLKLFLLLLRGKSAMARNGTEPSLVIPRKHFHIAVVGVLFQFYFDLSINFFFFLM